MRIRAFLASVVACASCTTAFGQVSPLQSDPPIDWAHLADIIVNRSLHVLPGEKVVLYDDPGFEVPIVTAVRAAVVQAGGIIIGEIPNWTDQMRAAFSAMVPVERTRYAQRQIDALAQTYAWADVGIWLPARNYPAYKPFERLTQRTPRMRTVHFHWILPPDESDRGRAFSDYVKAIDLMPQQLQPVLDHFASALRGSIVTLTTPDGTNLVFNVTQDAVFHYDSGEAGPSVLHRPFSTRTREVELPASGFRTVAVAQPDGVLVGHVRPDTRSGKVRVTFHGGRVVQMESMGADDADVVVAQWNASTDSKDQIGEFIVGTNPALEAILPSGWMPYFGTGAGTTRVLIGSNWESNSRTKGDYAMYLWMTHSTLAAGAATLIRDGNVLPIKLQQANE
jgi:hypothetical protein